MQSNKKWWIAGLLVVVVVIGLAVVYNQGDLLKGDLSQIKDMSSTQNLAKQLTPLQKQDHSYLSITGTYGIPYNVKGDSKFNDGTLSQDSNKLVIDSSKLSKSGTKSLTLQLVESPSVEMGINTEKFNQIDNVKVESSQNDLSHQMDAENTIVTKESKFNNPSNPIELNAGDVDTNNVDVPVSKGVTTATEKDVEVPISEGVPTATEKDVEVPISEGVTTIDNTDPIELNAGDVGTNNVNVPVSKGVPTATEKDVDVPISEGVPTIETLQLNNLQSSIPRAHAAPLVSTEKLIKDSSVTNSEVVTKEATITIPTKIPMDSTFTFTIDNLDKLNEGTHIFDLMNEKNALVAKLEIEIVNRQSEINDVGNKTIGSNKVEQIDKDGDGGKDSSPTIETKVMATSEQLDKDGDSGTAAPKPIETKAINAVEQLDKDGDGVKDSKDNCPAISNPKQADEDKDGIGDVCDTTPNPAPTDNTDKNHQKDENQKVVADAPESSTEACVIADKTFYLAGGPNSDYCKDLQDLVNKDGEENVFQADLAPETPQARYTTALATLRILKELGANIRTKNLKSDWYEVLADARNIENLSPEEISNSKIVFASGVLKGRVNPLDNSEITLAPLSRISYIELLAMFRQAMVDGVGIDSKIDQGNLPTFIIDEYNKNPDWKWIAEAYSFGVEFNLVDKNEFNSNTLFNYASRADMVKFLARFHNSIEKNPALLK